MRLFLAVDPGPPIRAALGDLLERLAAAHAGWRWARPASVHLTLRFLGEVAPERDAAARQGWQTAAAAVAPFAVRVAGLAAFPNERRPRVLVVPLAVKEDGMANPLLQLAAGVEQAARTAGFAAETRGFRPHLTLGRAKRGSRPVVPHDSGLAAMTFRVRAVDLVESTLAPSGARYTVLDTYPLAGCATEDA